MPSLEDVETILTPVIDVPATPHPGAAAGEPGSQLARTVIQKNPPPASAPDPAQGLVMAVPTTTPPASAPPSATPGPSPFDQKLDLAAEGAAGPIAPSPDPSFPVQPDQKTGLVANIGAGTSEAVAALLGLPVDATTMLLNVGAHALGVHPIQNPMGGAGTFEKLFGLIGANPQDVAPADAGERLARVASRGAASVALPGGVASRLVRTGMTAPGLAQLATGAGVGGATAGAGGGVVADVAGQVVPEPYRPLAEMIGGFVGGAGTSLAQAGAAATVRGVARAVRSAVYPSSRIPQIVGQSVLENAGGVPTAAPAPVPSVPLNLAQSTGRPEVSSALDTLNAADVPAMQRERSVQNAAMTDPLFGRTPGEPQMITGPAVTPDRIAAGGSTRATNALRRAGEIIDTEERRVWNTPALSRPGVSTQTSKDLINNEIARMQSAQPGLADAYDHSPLAPVVRDLNAMPAMASANELNSVRSSLLKVLRNPSVDGNVKVVARTLANLAEQGLDTAPEVAGRAAYSYTPVFPQPGWARAASQGTQIHVPAIAPDPALVRDWRIARAFTRREAEVLGHASFDNIMARNSYGNETATPGTALSRFFDFATGSEKPGEISNVVRFLNDIRTNWARLGRARGTYDPATIAPVMQDIAGGTRNYLFGKFLDAITSKEFDMSGNRQIQYKNVSEWLDNNRDMLARSGLVTPDQLSFLDRFRATAQLIERGKDLGRVNGSPTFTRAIHPVRFLDAFLGPLAGRGLGVVSGAVMGNFLTKWIGEAAIGGMIGAELGGAGGGAQALLQALYAQPRERLMAMLGDAYRNPEIARDLAMRINQPGARPSAATMAWMRGLLTSPPAIADATNGPSAGQAGSPPFPTPPQPPPERRSEIDGNPWAGNDPFARAVPTLADAADLAGKKWSEAREAARQSGMETPSGWPTQKAINEALRAYGEGLLTGSIGPEARGIRAFHGTPHTFDKFDISKIGTGEGAQAYGHGLYFAEREGIARDYRDQLVGKRQPVHEYTFNGQLMNVANLTPGSVEASPVIAMVRHNFDPVLARRELEGDLQYYTTLNERSGRGDWNLEPYQKALDWFDQNKHLIAPPPPSKPGGSMYEVNLKVNPDHMLDWDKPLSGQSPEVQKKIASNEHLQMLFDRPDVTAGEVVHRATRHRSNAEMDPAEMSLMLKEAGIPGVRYRDAASRNVADTSLKKLAPDSFGNTYWQVGKAGSTKWFPTEEEAKAYIADLEAKVTRNHVIFDDATIDIIRRYGLAGLIAGGAATGVAREKAQ